MRYIKRNEKKKRSKEGKQKICQGKKCQGKTVNIQLRKRIHLTINFDKVTLLFLRQTNKIIEFHLEVLNKPMFLPPWIN